MHYFNYIITIPNQFSQKNKLPFLLPPTAVNVTWHKAKPLRKFFRNKSRHAAFLKIYLKIKFLLEDETTPVHAVLAGFRSIHFVPCSKRIPAEISNSLFGPGGISAENIFTDGTKTEARSNKYTFVRKKATAKNQSMENRKNEAAASRFFNR